MGSSPHLPEVGGRHERQATLGIHALPASPVDQFVITMYVANSACSRPSMERRPVQAQGGRGGDAKELALAPLPQSLAGAVQGQEHAGAHKAASAGDQGRGPHFFGRLERPLDPVLGLWAGLQGDDKAFPGRPPVLARTPDKWCRRAPGLGSARSNPGCPRLRCPFWGPCCNCRRRSCDSRAPGPRAWSHRISPRRPRRSSRPRQPPARHRSRASDRPAISRASGLGPQTGFGQYAEGFRGTRARPSGQHLQPPRPQTLGLGRR